MKLMKISVLALALIGLGGALNAQTLVRGISVSGSSEIKVAPDLAIVSLGVSVEGRESAAVLDQTSAAVAAVLAELTALDIAEKDIQTSGVSLTPRYGQDSNGRMDYSKITGYAASNSMTVRVHDLLALGEVLSRGVSAGANRMNGISFVLEDDASILDQARRQAVADARHRAELYADAAGVSLGQVLSLSEAGVNAYGPPVMMEPMMEASLRSAKLDVPIATGEITVSASIEATFAIQ